MQQSYIKQSKSGWGWKTSCTNTASVTCPYHWRMSTVIILMHLNVATYYCWSMRALDLSNTHKKTTTLATKESHTCDRRILSLAQRTQLFYIAQPFNGPIEMRFWWWDGWWHQFNGQTNGTANKQSHSTNIAMNAQMEMRAIDEQCEP